MSGYGGTTTYQTQALMTASPAQLVAMLLEKATASLNEAIAAIESGQIEDRWRANRRAMEIINHLDLTLDMDRGGEIAENLRSLYSFALRRLADVDFKNDAEAAREVIKLLEPMLASWRELAKGPAEGQTTSQTTSQSAPPKRQDRPAETASISLNLSA